MKNLNVITFFVALVSLSVPLEAAKAPMTDKVWVVIRPVQCLGNLWEKDWLGKHNNQGTKYPRQKEFELLRSFFKMKKVKILELRVKPYRRGDALCQACDCPRGDTVYLLIRAEDVPKMVRLGYTERLPANDVPTKK